MQEAKSGRRSRDADAHETLRHFFVLKIFWVWQASASHRGGAPCLFRLLSGTSQDRNWAKATLFCRAEQVAQLLRCKHRFCSARFSLCEKRHAQQAASHAGRGRVAGARLLGLHC